MTGWKKSTLLGFAGVFTGLCLVGDPTPQPALAQTANADACLKKADSRDEKLDARLRVWPDTDTVFEPTRYSSLEAWKARREWLREQVRVAAGLWPEPQRCPLDAHIFGRIEGDGYTIEKVYFQGYPGYYVTGNLYRPNPMPAEKVPAVACPHGHWAKGRLHQDDLGNIPARCITLARLGATVLAYDMVGYNDSKRQIDHRINTPERDLWGITSLHLQTWNGIRVLDFLQSLPEVDAGRIGVTGASGGGTQTFILSAVDDRVSVAAPVNMISHLMQGGCVCENAPCLRIETNNMQIGALLAPKPLLMVSATGDWTKDTPSVEFPMIRSIYELYGAADRIANVHIDAPHNYNQASREAMYRFFGKWLLRRADAETITEGDIPVYKPEDLLVWSDETAPKDLLTVEQLTEQLEAGARVQIASLAPTSPEKYAALSRVVRTALPHVIGSQFPEIDLSDEDEPFATAATLPAPGEEKVHSACEDVYDWERRQGASGETTTEVSRWFRRDCTFERNGRRVVGVEIWPPLAETGITATTTTLVVSPEGAHLADAHSQLLDRLIGGRDLGDVQIAILIEPFGGCMPSTSSAAQPPAQSKPSSSASRGSAPAGHGRGSTKFFNTFNRADAAETVYDILTVLGGELRLTQGRPPDRQHPPRLVATGRLGPPALVARALVPDAPARSLRTVIDMNGFAIDSDAAYLKGLNLPHIRRIGGLRAIAAVACNGPIWFHNVGPHFDSDWVQAAGRVNGVEVKVTQEQANDTEIAAWLAK